MATTILSQYPRLRWLESCCGKKLKRMHCHGLAAIPVTFTDVRYNNGLMPCCSNFCWFLPKWHNRKTRLKCQKPPELRSTAQTSTGHYYPEDCGENGGWRSYSVTGPETSGVVLKRTLNDCWLLPLRPQSARLKRPALWCTIWNYGLYIFVGTSAIIRGTDSRAPAPLLALLAAA